MKNLLFKITCVVVISFSFHTCSEKQDEVSAPTSTEAKLAQAQLKFLTEIRQGVNSTVLPKSGVVVPENINNFMDYFGEYYKTMLIHVNQLEAITPSQNEEQYLNLFNSYMDQHPVDFDFMDFVVPSSPFFADLAEIILVINNDDANLSIQQLKNFENILVETSLLTELEKEGLLALSAHRKYVLSAISSIGLVVGGTVFDPVVDEPSAFWSCFDNEFNWAAGDCMEVLVNYDEPVLMGFAWSGLPGTLAGCSGHGIQQGIANCW